MKRVGILIVMIFAAALVVGLTGCQSSQELSGAVEGNFENLVNKATNPISTDTETMDGLSQALGIPEQYSTQVKGLKGTLTIQADAKIKFPNVTAIPMVKVTKGAFTETDVENLYHIFVGDSKVIDPDAGPLKSTLLEMIEEQEEQMRNNPDDERGYEEEFIQEVIDELLLEAESAPTSHEAVEPDFSFAEYDENMETGRFEGSSARLRFMPDETTISEIYVRQNPQSVRGAIAEYSRDTTWRSANGDSPLTISQEDAESMAGGILTKLGLSEDFICTGKRITNGIHAQIGGMMESKPVHEFMFTRVVAGIPITYTDDDGIAVAHESEDSPWMYEKIRIYVDDEGVLYFSWASPYVIGETVSENTNLLPFSDIEAVFESMMPVKYDYLESSEDQFWNLEVTEARLGLMRITDGGGKEDGLLIPVWDFFGTASTMGENGPDSMGFDYEYNSFLTINAIDGSIVDRELGY